MDLVRKPRLLAPLTVTIITASLLSACIGLIAAPPAASMTIDPDKGPSGTKAKITISGAAPNAAVTLELDPGTATGTTDANGDFTYDFTFFGSVGDVANVKATIGSGADEQTASATFEITAAESMTVSDATPTATSESKDSGLKVSCDPSQGPSGTTATITVTGGEPNQPVTLQIGEAITNGTTDADGNYSYEFTFYGRVGDIISIEGTVGSSSDSPKASTSFEITGALEGTFHVGIQVAGGETSHAGPIGLPKEMDLSARQGSLIIEGPAPWVDVEGEIGIDGSFSAEGSGTVAGYPDINVTFDGTISMDRIEGDYAMGVNGGLPGGQSIIYHVTGENDQSRQSGADDSELSTVVPFFEHFNQLQAAEDTEALFALLNPAVLELYGAESCRSYLESISNPTLRVAPIEVTSVGPWDWEIDGRTTPIDQAYTVQVRVDSNQGEKTQELHLAQRPDGSLSWFTDCGDPLN
jgi:hypothetical protein